MREDGWDKCDLCGNVKYEDDDDEYDDDDDGEDDDDYVSLGEESCDADMTTMAKAHRHCTSIGACKESCNNQLFAMHDCSMAEKCSGCSIHNFVATIV